MKTLEQKLKVYGKRYELALLIDAHEKDRPDTQYHLAMMINIKANPLSREEEIEKLIKELQEVE